MKEIKLFINGEFVDSSDKKSFNTPNPATGETLAVCAMPTLADVDRAIEAAHTAFYSKEWRSFDQSKRSDLLLAISEKILERKKDFIEMEMLDSASMIRKAKADIHNTASYFKVMSKMAKSFVFESKDEQASRAGFSTNYRQYMPIGVCAQIIPWNFPLVMAGWKIAPIIATGCTSVLKSAMETPVTAMMLAEVLKDVGLPKGVINIITGAGDIGAHLIKHPKVQKIAFTGSTAVGKEILKVAANDVKKVTLELGGKSANIVLDDADLSIAVDGALYAFLYHQGQACDSGTRLLVSDKIYDQFVSQLITRIKDIKIGVVTDGTCGFGPVISEKQFKTISGFIEKTKAEGGKILSGGEKINSGEFSKGFYIQPTLFEINEKNTIFAEEIFGPVLGITKFKTDEEAIALANNSKYGLAGAVWSQNNERALGVARALEAGTVWINEYHLLNPGMPFGGFKQSGLGREMGIEGMQAYLEVKHLWVSEANKRSDKVWFDAMF